MKKYDILIIGAGSVGVPLSYFLAQKGKKVAVIEKEPSVGRGQNRAAIGGIRATHSDAAKIRICQRSIELTKNMKRDHGMEVEWIQGGYLFPVYDEQTEAVLKANLVTQKKAGLNINWVGPEKINELAPGINMENLRGGTYSPEDGSASPMMLLDAFYLLAKNAGADFFFNEYVTAMEMADNTINMVKTNKDNYQAELVVNAAGAHGGEIGKRVGLDLPIFPDSHEGGITEPVKRFFEPMIVDIRPDAHSANYYFYQNRLGQVVFCITPDPKIQGLDCDNTSEFLPLVIKRMLNLYPRMRNLRVRRTWRGLYPMTPDGFPIVGFSNEVSNLLLAVGMCGQGFMIGPGLGEILAAIIVDRSAEYDFILKQLSLYREFSGDEVLK